MHLGFTNCKQSSWSMFLWKIDTIHIFFFWEQILCLLVFSHSHGEHLVNYYYNKAMFQFYSLLWSNVTWKKENRKICFYWLYNNLFLGMQSHSLYVMRTFSEIKHISLLFTTEYAYSGKVSWLHLWSHILQWRYYAIEFFMFASG